MDLSLVLPLHRAGDVLALNEAQCGAAVASYGGRARTNLHLEIVLGASGPAVELRMESKRPANGEMPFHEQIETLTDVRGRTLPIDSRRRPAGEE